MYILTNVRFANVELAEVRFCLNVLLGNVLKRAAIQVFTKLANAIRNSIQDFTGVIIK